MHIIILDEHEAALNFAVFAEMNDVLDESLALIVARMGFAGEDKLDGPLRVMDEFHDVFELLENQRRPFVSGETAREANGQCVDVEQLINCDKFALRESLALDQQSAAGKFDQFATQSVTTRPDLFVRNEIRVANPIPE